MGYGDSTWAKNVHWYMYPMPVCPQVRASCAPVCSVCIVCPVRAVGPVCPYVHLFMCPVCPCVPCAHVPMCPCVHVSMCPRVRVYMRICTHISMCLMSRASRVSMCVCLHVPTCACPCVFCPPDARAHVLLSHARCLRALVYTKARTSHWSVDTPPPIPAHEPNS